MISCKEVGHNDNLLLRLFPLSLDCLPLDYYMDLAPQSILSFSYFIEMFIHEFMRSGMEPYDPWNIDPLRQLPQQ